MGFSDRDFWAMLIFVGIIGWAIISGATWVFPHLSFSWG